jgi:hypothetical protein
VAVHSLTPGHEGNFLGKLRLVILHLYQSFFSHDAHPALQVKKLHGDSQKFVRGVVSTFES